MNEWKQATGDRRLRNAGQATLAAHIQYPSNFFFFSTSDKRLQVAQLWQRVKHHPNKKSFQNNHQPSATANAQQIRSAIIMTAVASAIHLISDDHCVGRNERPLLSRRPVHFPLPKKLGSDRLLLVSKVLKETPTYKSISPTLQKQRKSLKRHTPSPPCRQREVHFRAVDTVHEFVPTEDEKDRARLFFSREEFEDIHERDDVEFAICFQEMQYTKTILQLWGVCSRQQQQQQQQQQPLCSKSTNDDETCQRTALVERLIRDAPLDNARGLEHRIITGIRNHRQAAVRSFLQHHDREENAVNHESSSSNTVCPRYLKFSQTAGCFARALAEGDAIVARAIQKETVEPMSFNHCYS